MILPEERRKKLKLLLQNKLVKVIEAPNAMAAKILETTQVEGKSFDALWISSLIDSTLKGMQDNEFLNIHSRFQNILEVCEVTSKPIIYDGDTGSQNEFFISTINKLEKIGVSAIVIEDKTGEKFNSFIPDSSKHKLADEKDFCEKIKAGKKAQHSKDFMIIARLEGLIVGEDPKKILKRAFSYVDAGADGILVHSKAKVADEVFDLISKFRMKNSHTPITIIPTTYPDVHDADLIEKNINMVIYANQLTRSAHMAMLQMAKEILEKGNTKNIENLITPVHDLLK